MKRNDFTREYRMKLEGHSLIKLKMRKLTVILTRLFLDTEEGSSGVETSVEAVLRILASRTLLLTKQDEEWQVSTKASDIEESMTWPSHEGQQSILDIVGGSSWSCGMN